MNEREKIKNSNQENDKESREMPNYRELEAYFKPAFVERYSKLTNFEEFKKYSLSFLRKSIRVNTLKISVDELKTRLKEDWNLKNIPWANYGFWIEHKEGRRALGNLVEHSLGYFYVQEAASMLPPIILDPKPGDTILDMCASPRSKTSQMAQIMKNEGIILANDISTLRIKALAFNLQRCGVYNAVINRSEGRLIKGRELFDKILVDAPCSGTGTIRKSLKTITMWNPNMVHGLAKVQKNLISRAFELLKLGGVMVYSTCSCEPEENEGVVSYLLDKYENAELIKIDLPINRSNPITEFEGNKYNSDIAKCLRIWPQDNDTEGFFIAKIKKLNN